MLGRCAPSVVGPANAEPITRRRARESGVVVSAWLSRVVGDLDDLVDRQAQAVWGRFGSARFHGSIQPRIGAPLIGMSGHRAAA
jgi:hypothetical protein